MHYPIDLHIGSLVLSSHFIFNLISYTLATRYYVSLNKKAGEIFSHVRLEILMGGVLGAMLGARLTDMADAARVAVIQNIGLVHYFFFGGKTIVGAIAGGIVGIEIMKWYKKQPRSTGDMITFPLIYGIIIGRVGCFLTGVTDETVGVPSSLPWAFDQGDGIPRHPTSLYEILFLGLLWASLSLARKKLPLKEGVMFRLFIVSYFLFRLGVDFLKPAVPLWAGLTSIQLVCAVFAAWYTLDIIRKQFSYGSARV
jgi:phosphatidylglycerol---prolipoprotein diacylglyceryl transferase